LFLLLGLWGCLTEPDCFDTSTNYVSFGFYDTEDETVNVLVDSIAIDGIDGYLIPEDSLDLFQLPVDPAMSEAHITFYIDNEIETIELVYGLENQVVSEDCGALSYLVNLQLGETTFEEVTIVNNRVATNGGINVKIRME
jgi:hypothetical protein